MACIGTTNQTITLPFTMDVTPLCLELTGFSIIAFATQCSERTSCDASSRGVRRLINGSQGEDI